MQTKSATFITRVNQNTIVQLFLDVAIDKREIKVAKKSFILFGLDQNGHHDINAFSNDHFYAQTPSQAAYMVKKYAKKYCPADLENLENRFNTKFFQKFLHDSLSSISYKEEKEAFNSDVEKFQQEFKALLEKYNFNLRAYDGEGASVYIQRDRRDNNGYFESNDAFLSLEDSYVDL